MKAVLAIVMGMTLAVSVAACQKKEEPKKVVKTERVVVAPSPSGVDARAKPTVDNLDIRVTDIERRMAVARRQYAKDKAELRARLSPQ